MRYFFAAWLVTAQAVLRSPQNISVDIARTAAISSPALVSQAWESWSVFFQYAHLLTDPRLVAIASHLAPGVLRVGGITADWVRYPGNGDSFGGSGGGNGGGFWPAGPMNLTEAGFAAVAAFASSANLSLLLDLNEVYGRNCSLVRPDCPYAPPAPPPAWCAAWCGAPPEYPAWDLSNMLSFLRGLAANGTGGEGAPPLFYELGNELLGHLPPATLLADAKLGLAGLAAIWPGALRPPLAAPGTWSCQASAGTAALMAGLAAAGAAAFSFHMYPAGQPASFAEYAALVTNASWLRGGLLEDSATNASSCIADWAAGPRAAGLSLWITEANSGSGAAAAPGPASFAAGFYSLAQYGLLATAGVPLAARFGLCCDAPGSGGLATVTFNSSAAQPFGVVPDFWVMIARKRTAGDAALAVAGDAAPGSAVAVFASCALVAAPGGASADLARVVHPALGARGGGILRAHLAGGNGSVTISAVNTDEAAALPLALFDAAGARLATTPRLEWVFTAAGLDASEPLLNGDAAAPLRIGADGSLPPLPGRYVPAGGPADLSLPPHSQAFFLLLGAEAPACR